MDMAGIAFGTTDWASVEPTTHSGDAGFATWRTRAFHGIRVRMVEYSPGYVSDHWCSKGHVLFCIEGEMNTELEDGRVFRLGEGMCYLVGDNNEPHRSYTEKGCVLYIVD